MVLSPTTLTRAILINVGKSWYQSSQKFDNSTRRKAANTLSFLFTLDTRPRRSMNLALRDTRVNEPQIRAHLGTTAHLCKAANIYRNRSTQEEGENGDQLPSVRVNPKPKNLNPKP